MDYKTYQPLAMRTAKFFGDIKLDLQHAALGLTTEMAELFEATLDADDDHRMEEVADVFWYAALLCHVVGTSLDLVIPMADDELRPLTAGAVCDLGRVVGYVKRVAIYDKEPTPEMTREMLVDLSRMLQRVTFDITQRAIQEALAANIEKLRKRFPGAYSDEAAEARADKGGLDARNS